jgi:hypothetical protein
VDDLAHDIWKGDRAKRGMVSVQQPYACDVGPTAGSVPGDRPPSLYAYPPPVHPVEAVFIGWNPPRAFGGFWSTGAGDNLRTEIHGALRQIAQATALEPGQDFLDEFRTRRRFFFLHTVKCWTKAKYPGFGRGAKRMERTTLGVPLLKTCAGAHLGDELGHLRPRRVVALGELAYEGLCHLFPDLRSIARPTDGCVFKGAGAHPWPLLYTCFPSPAPAGGKPLRDYTRNHLESFLAHVCHTQ